MTGEPAAAAPAPALAAWRALQQEFAAADDYTALVRLARVADRLARDADLSARLSPVRVGVVSDATTALMLPVLKAGLVAAGLRPELHVAPYGQVTAALLDAEAPLARFEPHVVVVATCTAQLPGWPAAGATRADLDAAVDAACRQILEPCEVFHARTGADLIVNTFHSPPARAYGNLGAKLPGDPVNFVRRLNLALADRAPRFVHLNDVAYLAEREGLVRWFDPQYWFEARQPVSFEAVPEYGRNLAAMIGALRGRTRKCLVVDLDNTLWGGVVGDDGLAGIRIGQGNPVGEAHLAFQDYLRSLKDRGVLLAVSSKNDLAVAESPFASHPDMRLRLDDFVAFKANWGLKSDSLRAIARELDLPLDALVFVDDNPAERAEVRQAVPDVLVIDLPDDPAGFVGALERVRPFETAAITDEDKGRSAAYRARRLTIEAAASASDPRAYLASLGMQASMGPFDDVSIERVTQLVNKTNQFNLTTVRVQLADMRRLMTDLSAVTCMVRLSDCHADHGLISVVYGHLDGPRLIIDTWVMSCRVLGRGVEDAVFNYLLDAARARGVTEIRGEYRPTDRNRMVADHYERLGFHAVDERGAERWSLDLATARPRETFITVSANDAPSTAV
jgi:FkbH-like protein